MLGNKSWWGLMLTLWLGFWVVGIYRLDPDFGWHIRIGQWIAKSGVPKTDPFSYTMPGFSWVDHGLGSDVVLGGLYPLIGNIGLAAVFATLVVGVWIVSVPKNLRKWSLMPILLSAAMLFPRAGIRPQVQDWLYLAILLRWWQEEKVWQKWRGLVPVFFMYWANMHGGWAVGLGVLLAMIGMGWVSGQRREVKDGMVWVLGVLATLVNVYGWGVWHEVWLTVSDTNLKWSIAEWQPFFYNLEFGFLATAVMLIMFGWYVRKKVDKKLMVIVGLTFLAGLSSLRHVALFAVAVTVPLTMVLKTFYEEFQAKGEEVEKRLKIFYKILLIVVLVIFGLEVIFRAWEIVSTIKGTSYYPIKATEHLKKSNYPGNLFSEYGWGGYLLWKYPERKLFIDGRMPSWRYKVLGCNLPVWGDKCNVPNGESEWAFKEYLKIADSGEFKEQFKKYNVRVVLWPKYSQGKSWKGLADMIEKIAGVFGWKKAETKPGLLDKLREGKWETEYEDDMSVVLVKPDEW